MLEATSRTYHLGETTNKVKKHSTIAITNEIKEAKESRKAI
jgi:hypothetical protein